MYIFLHALLYWTSKLSLGGFTSNVLYLGYSLLLTFLYFVLTGSYPSPLYSPRQSVHPPLPPKKELRTLRCLYMGLTVAGSIGFIASYFFIRKIYGSIKID